MDGWNYFNYFTEIEEYFWKKRGAHLLVSPLDWAIMEAWQKAGVPLEAVLKGIDKAFESYQRSRRGAGKPLKSLAYCTDAVLEAAEEQQEAAAGSGPKSGRAAAAETFSREEMKTYFTKNMEKLLQAAAKNSATLPEMAARLTEIARSLEGSASLLEVRREVDRQLAPYRRKMKADQLALIERQYVQKRLLEEFGLPRLSLFYLA